MSLYYTLILTLNVIHVRCVIYRTIHIEISATDNLCDLPSVIFYKLIIRQKIKI